MRAGTLANALLSTGGKPAKKKEPGAV